MLSRERSDSLPATVNLLILMLTIAIILIALWALGFLGFHVLGGFIHILLVIAIILFLIRIIRGENPFR